MATLRKVGAALARLADRLDGCLDSLIVREPRSKRLCDLQCAAKAVGDAAHDAGEGMKGAWNATKSWSTNAWEATKHGVDTAVDATKDAAESARIGIVEFFGGIDAPKKAEKKSGKAK